MKIKRGRPALPICPYADCARKFKGPQGLAAHLRHNHVEIPAVQTAAKPNGHGPLSALLDLTDKRITTLMQLREHIVGLQKAASELGLEAH